MESQVRYGGSYCSVVSCHNCTRRDAQRGIRFHQFPMKDAARCEVWIRRVNRKARDGTLWRPSKSSVICSEHFVGGRKSDDPKSPAYNPSLFPTEHVKPQSSADVARYERLFARQERKNVLEIQSTNEFDVPGAEAPKTCEVSTQTDCDFELQSPVFAFHMDILSSSEKSTYANVPVQEATGCQTEIQGTTDPALSILSYNESQFKGVTGVSRNFFNYLSYKVGDKIRDTKKLSKNSKLLLFLMKMKLHLSFVVLSALFSVSKTTARSTFFNAVDIVHEIAEHFIVWFDRETIKARMPASFRGLYPNTRVIIDCTEIECERPGTQRQRILMWSQYKSRWTVKFLLGIAPSGEVTFVSRAFGGRTTDCEITNQSGILQMLEPTDVVLADKGFPHIENKILESGAVLVMPPFRSGERQFTTQQNRDCYEVAKVRIHVERAIRRLKYFEVLNFVPSLMLPKVDKIFVIVSFFANFFNDLIHEES